MNHVFMHSSQKKTHYKKKHSNSYMWLFPFSQCEQTLLSVQLGIYKAGRILFFYFIERPLVTFLENVEEKISIRALFKLFNLSCILSLKIYTFIIIPHFSCSHTQPMNWIDIVKKEISIVNLLSALLKKFLIPNF